MKIPYSVIKSRNKLISTDGLALYSYILCCENRLGEIKITTKMIKESGILKDNRKITKVLQELHKEKYIELTDGLDIIDRITDSTTIQIKLNSINQFLKVPYGLYVDYIDKIGSIGYSVLCLLSIYHNNGYGGISNYTGFSNPSYETLSDLININRKTIIKYIEILKKNKLIKVESQPLVAQSDLTFKQESNHYIVKFITDEKDKYYCPK